jgi:preprotein translocase subunit SecB
MQLSPLQLLRCSFESVNIVAMPECQPDQFAPGLVIDPQQMDLSSEVAVSDLGSTDGWSDYALRLVLSFRAKEAHVMPYQGELVAQAVVRMHGEPDLHQRKQLAVVNGVSLIYGVVRDMVCMVTSRGQHGQMLLPTLNFRALADALETDGAAGQRTAAQAEPAAKPKPRKRRTAQPEQAK